jgi:apolipoprotein D and lipocalin family protein
MRIVIPFFALFIIGCTGLPQGVKPVENFQAKRYLGKWYEIARLDHSFERGLNNVTAYYSLRSDGGIRVLNRGYSEAKREWKTAKGKAYFVGDSDKGHLKVSFWGPFYGSYVIIALDHENYQYSLVCGPDRDYLWLLSRSPAMDEKIKNELIDRASELGFDTSKLIIVSHN